MGKAASDRASTSLSQPLYRAEQVRQGEQLAASKAGVAMYQLMERAGQAAYACLRQRWPEVQRLLVLCGKGNNAGDGYVLARLAIEDGLDVELFQLAEVSELSEDASRAHKSWQQAGGQPQPDLASGLKHAELVVDALLGTGLRGEVREPFGSVFDAVNHSPSPVLAIDIPSGLDADRGLALGRAIRADATVTFVGRKIGMVTGQARELVGQLVFDDLGIGAQFSALQPAAGHLINSDVYRAQLKPRHRCRHKGDFGKLIVVGGERGMPGSVRLAAEAALRTGAGLLMVVTRPGHAAVLLSGRPELMVLEADEADDLVQARMEWADALVVGPGLGRNAWGQDLLQTALAAQKPLLLDADGLNLLAEMDTTARQDWILTPHPGEAARLLGCAVSTVERDRFAAVEALQQKYGGTIVLKGAGTLVYDGRRTVVNDSGNPGMASGGMGDTLSGIIGILLAQGLAPFDAASLGICLHGEAADMAARHGERGLLASDLFEYLRHKVNPV